MDKFNKKIYILIYKIYSFINRYFVLYVAYIKFFKLLIDNTLFSNE